jgi:hypothetical protein
MDMSMFHKLSIGIFFVIALSTVITLGTSTANNDMAVQMKNAILYITLINGVMVLILMGLAYFYLATNTVAERNYVIIILHLGLLLSITSVSVTSLQNV